MSRCGDGTQDTCYLVYHYQMETAHRWENVKLYESKKNSTLCCKRKTLQFFLHLTNSNQPPDVIKLWALDQMSFWFETWGQIIIIVDGWPGWMNISCADDSNLKVKPPVPDWKRRPLLKLHGWIAFITLSDFSLRSSHLFFTQTHWPLSPSFSPSLSLMCPSSHPLGRCDELSLDRYIGPIRATWFSCSVVMERPLTLLLKAT